MIEDAFLFLQDQAGGQVFDEEEIEKESGVVLEEMRTINSTHYRAFFSNLGFMLGDSQFANRSPLGNEETVNAFQKANFEDFYQKWHTADRMIVVGVGSMSLDSFK